MNNLSKRLGSIAIAFLMTIISLPLNVVSNEFITTNNTKDEYGESSGINQKTVDVEMKEKYGQGIVEIESLREENSKHFQLEDGSYQAIAYSTAVHRQNTEGIWQDIDNRLYIEPEKPYLYSTHDGRFSFAANSSSDILCTINDGTYSISFGPLFNDVNPSSAVIENHSDRLESVHLLEGEEKLNALINVDTSTKVLYHSVLDKVDLEYVLTGNDVKEKLILTAPTDVNNLSFKMTLNDLSAEYAESGSILLINNAGEAVYCISAPFMYDESGEESLGVSYALMELDGEYIIRLIVDEDWINDSSRVYPIVIDPSVTKCSNILSDAHVSPNYPSTNYGNNQTLLINSNTIAFLRAAMPQLPTYARIDYASLKTMFYSSSTTGSVDINLYRCKRNWNENTITWNTISAWTNYGLATARSSHATATISSGITSSSPGTLVFNVTSLVKGWYSGNTIMGVGLRYDSGTASSIRIYSHEAQSTFGPYFAITYTVISDPVIQNGTYFLENKKTGKYVDIQDGDEPITEGFYTHQWKFLGINTQKWIITYSHNSNYYTINSAKAPTFYMRVKDDSPDANIRIVLSTGNDSNGTRTITNGMLWGFSTTSSGAYKIGAIVGESNDRVLAVGSYVLNINGIDIEQRNYSNNTDYIDEWMPYKTDGQTDMFLAITESDGRDRVSGFDPIFGYIYNYGRNDFNFRYTNSLSVSNCLSQMEDATIFVFRGHGNYDSNSTWIQLNEDNDNPIKLKSTHIYSNGSLVDFSGMEIAVFAACCTGKNNVSRKNLVDASVNAGATYAIGFNEVVLCSSANTWIERFFYYYYSCNNNVLLSCQYATSDTQNMSGKVYLVGNTNGGINHWFF